MSSSIEVAGVRGTSRGAISTSMGRRPHLGHRLRAPLAAAEHRVGRDAVVGHLEQVHVVDEEGHTLELSLLEVAEDLAALDRVPLDAEQLAGREVPPLVL